jgi:TolB protein
MRFIVSLALFVFVSRLAAPAAESIDIHVTIRPGETPPTWVNISGISGGALQVLQFDLYVQGFNFTNAESAQYLIAGKSNGNFEARAMDRFNKNTIVSKAYSGATLRRQVHKFVDEFTSGIQRKAIAETRIAFKGVMAPGHSEVFVSDFDGHNAGAITADGSIVSAPAWVPGRDALYYGTYKLNHADIAYHNVSTRERRSFAHYGGSNISPAPSPDGSKVAMILSKDGWTDLYVCNSDGSDLRRLTKSPQDESSPCWSPDGRWICFASKEKEHRALHKVSVSGGTPQVIRTVGVLNPTEPDWSPDGKWIAFTSQMGSFHICVVPAEGGNAIDLTEGEDPSWSPNSRTLICTRRTGEGDTLMLLDVPTKQQKDVSRISGSSSQSQPSWAR